MLSENVTRYPLGFRIMVIVSLIFGTASGLGVIVTLADTWNGYSRGDPEFAGLLLAFRLAIFGVLGAAVTAWFLCGAIYHWYTLSRFAVNGHILHVYGPIVGLHRTIDLSSVESVQAVPPLVRNSRRPESSSYVRVLRSRDGKNVRMSTDLSIWPAIASCLEAAGHSP